MQQLRVLPGGSLDFFGILDEHRTGSAERAMAMTSHLYLVLEAAVDPQHNLEWAWPLLGVLDPEGRHNMQRSPLKQSGLISFHTETVVNEEAKRRLTSAASSTMPQTDFSQLQGVRNELKKQRSSGEERQACQASTAEARKRTMEGARSSSSGFSRNWEREVLLPVVPCVQRTSAEPWSRYQRR